MQMVESRGGGWGVVGPRGALQGAAAPAARAAPQAPVVAAACEHAVLVGGQCVDDGALLRERVVQELPIRQLRGKGRGVGAGGRSGSRSFRPAAGLQLQARAAHFAHLGSPSRVGRPPSPAASHLELFDVVCARAHKGALCGARHQRTHALRKGGGQERVARWDTRSSSPPRHRGHAEPLSPCLPQLAHDCRGGWCAPPHAQAATPPPTLPTPHTLTRWEAPRPACRCAPFCGR